MNRSGYERGVTPPPRTFSADMLVKPDLMESEQDASPFLEYKDKFDFPVRTATTTHSLSMPR